MHRPSALFITSSTAYDQVAIISCPTCAIAGRNRLKVNEMVKSLRPSTKIMLPPSSKYFDGHGTGGILKSNLSIIGKTFSRIFLTGSIRKGLLNTIKMVLAGDGTPVVVSNRERSHSICDCHKRWFSQPDANWGWDSSRNSFCYGYNLYLFTDANSGLPAFPIL